MTSLSNSYRYVRPAATAALVLFCLMALPGAHVSATDIMQSSVWMRGQPVVITGESLQGDQPDAKKLCIAPRATPTAKKCYAVADLPSGTWTNAQISFIPPEDAPAWGIVTAQLKIQRQQCSGTAECVTFYDDVEKPFGNFTIAPTVAKVTNVTNAAAPVPATSIEPWKVYQVDGWFFGTQKGGLYLRQSRESKEVPAEKIYSWNTNSITFASPTDAEVSYGISINNFAAAQWYDFPGSGTDSSTSSTQSKDPISEKVKNMKVIGVLNVFNLLQANQKIADQYAASIATVGQLNDPICKSLNFKETTNACTALCKQSMQDTCKASCEDKSESSSCMIACYAYKPVLDAQTSCNASCIKQCAPGAQCVCMGGKVNNPANIIWLDAENTLTAGYSLLYEDPTTEKTLIQDLEWQLQKAGLKLIKKKDGHGALVAGAMSSVVSSSAAPTFFTDVDEKTHPYAAAIKWARDNGVSQGYPDGTFQPERIVNRAELLKLLLTAKKISVESTTGATGFSDVQEDAWYVPFIRVAKAKEIVQGYPDGTFKPEQPVNGAEALKMAYIALGVQTTDIGGPWYQRYLQHAQVNHVLFDSSVYIDVGMKRKDIVWIIWKLMSLPSATAAQ